MLPDAQAVIRATYFIETPRSVEHAAEVLAGEQSSGTFTQVPGETEQLKRRFRARVVCLEPLDSTDTPSLPGSRPRATRYQRARITVDFPLVNMGTNLPTLLATVTGNLFELAELSGVKLLDLDLPPAFADAYAGPAYGIAGTRRLTCVQDRPLIGTIIKPSVGLSPQDTADLVKVLVEGGIDFIKDDELMANPPHSPLTERVPRVMRVIRDAAERTGKQAMYAFNISDDIDQMRRHHDLVVREGGTCVMLSLNHVGLAGVLALRRAAQVPIHGHRNGWGMLTRHPGLGIDFRAYQKIWRLAGVDHIHVNGLRNKFWEPDESVVRSIESCFEPLFPLLGQRGRYALMPVISSGQWAGQAFDTYARTRSVDFLYLAGGGIMAHPGGPAAGVRSLTLAWEAAVDGCSLEETARKHVEVQQAVAKFGAR